ncbi:MAG: hypothetical protein H6729_16500 [Deltaproteobacteria bacterium]|nr:hypothetical protein [Deltaproteobacteria bacterium]
MHRPSVARSVVVLAFCTGLASLAGCDQDALFEASNNTPEDESTTDAGTGDVDAFDATPPPNTDQPRDAGATDGGAVDAREPADAEASGDPDAQTDAGDQADASSTRDAAGPFDGGPPVIGPLPVGDLTTQGTEFWVAFMDNISLVWNGPPSFSIVVSAEAATNGTIRIPATGFESVFSVDAGTATEIPLPRGILYPETSENVTGTGIVVQTTAPVSLYAIHYRLFFSESTLVLPIARLGSEYWILAGEDADGIHPSELIVLSPANDVSVEITPSGTTYAGHPAARPFTVTLDAGETYQIKAYGDLSGTHIKTLNPEDRIAVFSGAQQANIDKGTNAPDSCVADSHLYDQNHPVKAWGLDYVVVPFLEQGGDPIRIIAAQTETEVRINCGPPILLGPGEVIKRVAEEPMHIVANHPIAVAQLDKGQGCNASGIGDPSFLLLSPVAMTTQVARWISPTARNMFDEPYVTKHLVNVVAPNTETRLWLDGHEITPSARTHFGRFALWQVEVSPGAHVLEADRGIQASSYGFGDFDGYTNTLGYHCDGCQEALREVPECP